jgi:xylulokinase
MPNPLILAHDVGTSGTKSVLVRPDGAIVASQTSAHETRFPRPGWAEQQAEDWWEGVCRNTGALTANHPELRGHIAVIGVSGHMLGCLPVDSEGRALRPCLIHSDCRATDPCAMIRSRMGPEAIYERTGNILDPRSSLCKVLWVKENEPQVYGRTARFLQSKDYIVGRMTGRYDSTDYSDASHAQWLDITARSYAADLFAELGLDLSKFPALHRATDVVGKLTQEAARALDLPAGIPVVAGGGDGSCASAGAGAVKSGDIYCCLGTTAWIAATTAEPLIDRQRRVFNVLALDGVNNGVFGTVQAAGRSVNWAMDLFGEKGFGRFDELLAGVRPGSEGLIFLPYLEGERSPIFDPDARGVFFGLSPWHRREHFLRATVEGVSFALRSVLEVIRESFAVPALRLIGGGGQSHLWQQLLADVCGVTIQSLSTQSADATSLGAAFAAGVGVGLFENLSQAAQTVEVTKERALDPALAKRYDRSFRVYQSLYPQLKPVFTQLQEALEGDEESEPSAGLRS